ncbi:thiamine phosphate synthase [Sedimentitalea todarodis]|uniref:Thiamine-phosphate synthase n=1 Tax=Sedimentitalea todarodis TaxID=1631240 RepID=A0ABU3VEB7_9RHOB|nr:thiamine phosphate synthase [Sedimentitalea todarodis]MDU9004509.1 thiamine phosphate synthase [Sedimentitalea todarodis]
MAALKDRLCLYLVTDTQLCAKPGVVETVRRAVAGGVTMVQLRDKTATTAQRTELAIALKQVLDGSDVPLVINDDVTAAVAADVDGAHIGQGDLSPEQARALLGPGKILGLSCETPQTVQAADPLIVDYLGLGPVFETPTKTDHAQPIGFDGLARLVALSSLPSVAIGGLYSTHVSGVRLSGADGMAVVSAICGQPDPYAAARAFDAARTERAT